MAHYYPNTLQSTLTNWSGLLETDKAKALHPRVFVYELNSEIDLSVYKPLLGQDGVAVHLDNVGREGAVFLRHIIEHYDDLADHTLFSQAMADAILNARFEHLFGPNTGVLSLALYAHQYCNVDDVWLPTGQLAQLYSLFTRQFCPPEGYSCMFEGGFVVSRKRIRAHPKSVYEHIHSLLAAPMTHWIHTVHSNPHYKHTSNPFFGHSMERAWSLAFDCHDLWRYEACQGCDKQGYKDCHPEACQCFDD